MEKITKTVSIVWWGIGWLASAILLAKSWYKASLYEKNECLGGRASILHKDGYTFDMGPSRYLMPDIFEEFFENIGENIHDHLDLQKLSPSYRVFYEGRDVPLARPQDKNEHADIENEWAKSTHLQHLDIYSDPQRMSDTFESMEVWAGKQFLTFLERAKIQYEIGMEFCKKNYDSVFDFFRRDIMRKGIKLNIRTTIDKYVARFFQNQLIRKIMQYTTVFLGTAPKQTPALYNIMSHCDFWMGVWYPKWWLHEIAKALYAIGLKHGVEYHLNTEVVWCDIENNQIKNLKIKKNNDEMQMKYLNFYDQETRERIISGRKTIETRALNPEEWERYFWNIKNGDTIAFINKVTWEQECVRVLHTYIRKDLEEYSSSNSSIRLKVSPHRTIDELDSLEKITPLFSFTDNYVDKINANGLIGWEFEMIKKSILIINNYSKHIHELEHLIIEHWYNIQTITLGQLASTDTSGFDAVILSGWSHLRPVAFHPEDYVALSHFIINYNKPIIWICLGAQIIAHAYGSTLSELDEKIDWIQTITMSGVNKKIQTIEHHRFAIEKLWWELESIAHSDYGIEIFKHRHKDIYGFQYHPECDTEKQAGDEIFTNTLERLLRSNIVDSKAPSNEELQINSDIYLINADMAWFETSILPKESQTYPRSYRDSKIFAPSGFIIYAWVSKKLPNLDHHNLYFCEDRDKNFWQIFDTKELPDNPSIYVSKITHTDPTMAPEWCENLFILVPIPNGIEISDNQKEQYKHIVRGIVEKMAGENIVWHIDTEQIFTVDNFKSRYNSRNGTALGLAHPIMQTAVFRPNNISKKLDNLFYVWHNTNPGIGVPMVIISAQLALERIKKRFTS